MLILFEVLKVVITVDVNNIILHVLGIIALLCKPFIQLIILDLFRIAP